MADLFLSYARADQRRSEAIAAAAAADGRSVWWDRRLAGGADYGLTIERELEAAGCVLVAWSATARASLWVRAEANEALDAGKLVQINLDGSKPPLPFTMLHWTDFRGWDGGREQAPWPDLKHELDGALGTAAPPAAGGRRPNPGGVPIVAGPGPALQGFGTAAALGWTALVTAMLMAFAVLMVVRRTIPAEAFATFAIVLLVVAFLVLAACGWIVLRTLAASRR